MLTNRFAILIAITITIAIAIAIIVSVTASRPTDFWVVSRNDGIDDAEEIATAAAMVGRGVTGWNPGAGLFYQFGDSELLQLTCELLQAVRAQVCSG